MMPTDSPTRSGSTAPDARSHVTALDLAIGDAVHLLMRHKGIAQSNLAPKLGMDPTLLGRKLRGKRRWYVSEVVEVAVILDVSFDQLLPAGVTS